MKKIAFSFCVVLMITLFSQVTKAQTPAYLDDIMFQAFGWDEQSKHSADGNYYMFLQSKVSELKAAGFDMIWMPPPSKSTGGVGYYPTELYNFNSDWGTSTDLTNTTAAIKAAGMHPLADVVVNHRSGTTNWSTFTNPDWGTTLTTDNGTICTNDEVNTSWVSTRGPMGTGATDEGQSDSGCRDLDHSNATVQAGVKAYLLKLKEQGFEGYRWDMTKGYKSTRVNDYLNSTSYYYSVGEYLDGNQGLLQDWINGSSNNRAIQSGTFDFSLYYNSLSPALRNNNWSLLTSSSGLAGSVDYNSNAVTLVDNHDTFTDATNAILGDNIMKGYAYIMTHKGIPCVFLPHYYGGTYTKSAVTRTYTSNKIKIDELMAVRKKAGIDSWSSVTVDQNTSFYAAYIYKRYGDAAPAVAVKIGAGTWTPSGTGWILNTFGTDYAVWSKNAILTAPGISPSGGNFFVGKTITMTASTGSTIHYTLDGTEPTINSTTYTGAITLPIGIVTVKALAEASGAASPVVTSVFNIQTKPSSITVRFKAPASWTTGCAWVWELVNGVTTSLNTKKTWPGDLITKDAQGYYTYTFTNMTQPTVFIIFNNGNGTTATEQTIDLSTSTNICWVYSGSNKYTVTVDQSCITEVETPVVDEWNLYPNPTNNKVQFTLPENTRNITVMSALGRQLKLENTANQTKAEIDLSNYPSGIYYVTIWNKDGVKRTKPVVKM
ncbi:MAG: alpha-amylase family glycosyl hydrolase [Paludibacter sp.]